jgi:ADP-ribose pyrophosphatase YjhB (NUDIX family)
MWPKVGVSSVILARTSNFVHAGHVALIRRATNPAKNQWSFPGGKLNLGESIADCAAREAKEETGLNCDVFNRNIPAFAVTDSITRGKTNDIEFHYAVVHVLMTSMAQCMGNDGDRLILPTLLAGDDADDALWFRIDDLIKPTTMVTSSTGKTIYRSSLVPKLAEVLLSLNAHLKSSDSLKTRDFELYNSR